MTSAMPEETFRIRIKPDGSIHFQTRELDEERLRLLRDMLEDCLGTVVEVRPSDSDDGLGPGVRIASEAEQERLRHRR